MLLARGQTECYIWRGVKVKHTFWWRLRLWYRLRSRGPVVKGWAKLQRDSIFLAMTMVVILLVMASSCGATLGKAKIEVAELGLSMELPSGWTLGRVNPGMFVRGDTTGLSQ